MSFMVFLVNHTSVMDTRPQIMQGSRIKLQSRFSWYLFNNNQATAFFFFFFILPFPRRLFKNWATFKQELNKDCMKHDVINLIEISIEICDWYFKKCSTTEFHNAWCVLMHVVMLGVREGDMWGLWVTNESVHKKTKITFWLLLSCKIPKRLEGRCFSYC